MAAPRQLRSDALAAPTQSRGQWLRRAEAVVPPLVAQRSLFGVTEPRIDPGFAALERIELGQGAWLDVQQHWLRGHQTLFDVLYAETDWHSHTRDMYDRHVAVPRLTGVPAGGRAMSVIERMSEALSRRYGRALGHVSLACYRDGRDSVAPHGDTLGVEVDDAIVAIVSVGAPRRFSMRRVEPDTGGGNDPRGRFWISRDSLALRPGQGDLLVMGGTCQRTWLHGVPKAARAEPRISIMFR